MKKSLLITGASGLLGSNFFFNLANTESVVGLCHERVTSIAGQTLIPCDLNNSEELQRIFDKNKPTHVIHCAAMTNVDACEENPELAFKINTEGSKALAKICSEHACQLTYISTDAVYSGDDGNYSETSPTLPKNIYARSKLQGEQAVLTELASTLIFRTNIYGCNHLDKMSFGESILKEAKENKELTLFGDVLFSPLLVNDLIQVALEMITAKAAGIYNLGSTDHMSKFDFGKLLGEIFDLRDAKIKSISVADKKLKAKRPKNTSLDVSKIEAFLGKKMPTVEEGLRQFRLLYDSGYSKKLKRII